MIIIIKIYFVRYHSQIQDLIFTVALRLKDHIPFMLQINISI